MHNILYLASKSASRRLLLQESKIPFTLIDQDANELACDWGLPLEQLVLTIALYKMDHAILPAGTEGQIIFVLTADTLTQDLQGIIHGKPTDYDDAVKKIKSLRAGSRVFTGFCLDKKIFENGAWCLVERYTQCVGTQCIFTIPDNWIATYLAQQPTILDVAGAMAIEGFGMQFLASVDGSYSAIIGLPLMELRQALEQLGFFSG